MLKLKSASLAVLFAFLLPVVSFAASFDLKESTSGVFTLQGTNIDGIAGLDITMKYDTNTLSNPRVDSGSLISGSLFQANPNYGIGAVRAVALAPSGTFRGSGPVAVFSFSKNRDATGIVDLTVKAINSQGVTVAAAVTFPTDTVASGSPDTSGTTGGGTTFTPSGGGSQTTVSGGTAPTATTVLGGTVTLPTDESVSRERKVQAVEPDTAAAAASPSSAPREQVASSSEPREPANTEKPVEKADEALPLVAPVPSVLERFRLYVGDRTEKTLTAFFDRGTLPNFVQDPPVFIADGKGTVKVTISKVTGEKAPNFAFNGVRYVSLAKTGEGEWQIEVRPDKSAVEPSINMLVNGVVQEFPLAVAPKTQVDLVKRGQVSEADFQLFMKERGTDAAPKYDLNGDGKRDFVDDYIFTANYLVERARLAAKEKAAPTKTAK